MNDLKTILQLVKSILEENERARNSDSFLYLKVIEAVGQQVGHNPKYLTVPDFLLNMDALGFPGFETVRRTRQKVQQQHPELASSAKVSAYRAINEEAFRDFARGHIE